MLYEAHGITKFIVVCGYTDLRRGLTGLTQLIEGQYGVNPYEAGTLFLFCGSRGVGDRIKCLLRYLKHLLSELPKRADRDGNIDPSDLDEPLPWSATLPEECYKRR